MNILNKLERKFGRYAIKQLIVYIVGINALIYMLRIGMPQSDAISKLLLDPHLIMQGEVWRLITWVFIPPSASLLWIFFILYFYYMIGTGLEHEWGSFRFNIYYFTGVAATAIAAFITGQGATALYLNLSLFLAFAYIYPDFRDPALLHHSGEDQISGMAELGLYRLHAYDRAAFRKNCSPCLCLELFSLLRQRYH